MEDSPLQQHLYYQLALVSLTYERSVSILGPHSKKLTRLHGDVHHLGVGIEGKVTFLVKGSFASAKVGEMLPAYGLGLQEGNMDIYVAAVYLQFLDFRRNEFCLTDVDEQAVTIQFYAASGHSGEVSGADIFKNTAEQGMHTLVAPSVGKIGKNHKKNEE